MNCYKLLADYRLTWNIQVIRLEWSDILSWGRDVFKGYFWYYYIKISKGEEVFGEEVAMLMYPFRSIHLISWTKKMEEYYLNWGRQIEGLPKCAHWKSQRNEVLKEYHDTINQITDSKVKWIAMITTVSMPLVPDVLRV